MVKQESFFKRRKTLWFFSAFALLLGFTFLNQGITGNAVLSNSQGFDPLPLIGLLLVFCSAILALYTIRKK